MFMTVYPTWFLINCSGMRHIAAICRPFSLLWIPPQPHTRKARISNRRMYGRSEPWINDFTTIGTPCFNCVSLVCFALVFNIAEQDHTCEARKFHSPPPITASTYHPSIISSSLFPLSFIFQHQPKHPQNLRGGHSAPTHPPVGHATTLAAFREWLVLWSWEVIWSEYDQLIVEIKRLLLIKFGVWNLLDRPHIYLFNVSQMLFVWIMTYELDIWVKSESSMYSKGND